MNATELRTAFTLAIVYVLRMLGLFMVMPVLAIMAMDYPDYSVLLVGIAIGGYGLTQAVLQIPMGMLSDRIGRKPVIILGLLLFGLGSVVAAVADTMTMLVIGRLLQGAGAIAGAIMALAADVSRESQRAKVMAIIGVAIGFSFYLALLIGPIIASQFGLSGIFAITALMAILCIPLIWFAVPSVVMPAPSGDTLPSRADIGALFRHPQLAKLNVSVCLLHMLITLFFVQLPGMLVSAGLAFEQHWGLYLVVLTASIIGLSILMMLNRRVSRKALMLFSISLLIMAFAGFMFAQQVWAIGLFAIIFFSGFNYLEANLPAWVSSIAPAGKKGSAMGMFASFQFFGAFLGGIISGVLSQYFDPIQVFVFAIIMLLIWALIIYGLDSVEIIKRYSLSINNKSTQKSKTYARLISLPGVEDIDWQEQAGVVYIKGNRQFEVAEAHKILASQDAIPAG